MSELVLTIRIEGEGDAFEERVDKLEDRIDASGVGDAAGHMSALGEAIVFVDLPPACTEAELPAKMQALREILVGEGLDGVVEIPDEAGDDEDEGWEEVDGEDGDGGEEPDGR